MASSIVVVIVLAAADLGDPSVGAMTASAQRALGPAATIVVRGVDRLAGDGELVELETALHAEAVIDVSWPGAAHDHAHLHVHAHAKDPAWVDRDVAFQASDVPVERGRTLGFAIASMVPLRSIADTPPPPPPPPPAEPATPAPSLPTPEPAPAPAPSRSSPPPPRVVNKDATPPPPAAPPATTSTTRSYRAGFDLAGLASFGVGGVAGGLGGELGGRYWLSPSIAAVARGSAARGDIALAQASTTALRMAAGLSVELLPETRRAPFALDVDATLGAVRHSTVRIAAGELTSAGDRWISMVQLRVDAVWWLMPQTGLVASIGTELAFGPTDVRVDGAVVATIPWMRGIATAGLRTRF